MPLGPRSPLRRSGHHGRPSATLLVPLLTLLPLLLSIPQTGYGAVLEDILVTPAGLTMAPEEFRQFVATAVFSDGSQQDITAVADWSTGDSRVAKVNEEHGKRGIVEARDPGSVEIRAALDHGGSRTRGDTILTVFAGAIVDITTRPSSKNLDVGYPEQFKARAQYVVNDYIGDVTDEVTWTSSDPTKATVNAAGLVTPLQDTGEGFITITAFHPATGLQNTDGDTTIKPAITHLDYDEDLELPESGALVVTMGAGMITATDVFAHRVDGTKSRVTKDITFEIIGAPGIVKVYKEGELEGREAGDVEGLSDGFVLIRATDLDRGLTAVRDLVVVVSGTLTELTIGANPFKATVGAQKTAGIVGLLSSGTATRDLRKILYWSTGNPAIAVVGADSESDAANVGKVTGISVGATTLTATEPNTGVSVTVPLEVRGALLDVAVAPDEVVLGVGMYLPLRANGIRSDGSKSTVTSQVTWEVTPPSLATINPAGFDLEGNGVFTKGVIETLSAGTGTIRAILNTGTAEEPNEIASPAIPISVAGTLVSVRVRPTKVKVIRDQRRKAGLEGGLSTGATTSDLAAIAHWTVADTQVALVGNGDDVPNEEDPLERGEVLGLDSGVTTLIGTEPISGISSTEVDNLQVQGDVTSVEVDEANGGVVQVGTPGEYKARATFADDSKGVISDRCEWSIDDESVATVDNVADKGMVTGILIGGRTTIRIDCDGLKAKGIVEVAGNIVGLDISPERFSGKALRERQFRAAADYVGGARGDATDVVDWASDDTAVATVDNNEDKGRVRFLSDGEAFISATAPSGHVAIATVEVNGGVTSLRVVPNSKTIRGSTGRKLKVIAELSDGDQSTVTNSVSWVSSDEEIARMSDRPGEERVALGGAKLGTATLTASLPSGETGSTEITINSLLTGLSMRPDRRTIKVAKHRRVTARGHFDDGKTKSVSRYVEFISDDPTIATVQSGGSKPGRVTGLAPGTTTIRAIDPATGFATDNVTVVEVVAP